MACKWKSLCSIYGAVYSYFLTQECRENTRDPQKVLPGLLLSQEWAVFWAGFCGPERPVEGWCFSGCLLVLWKVKHDRGMLALSLQWVCPPLAQSHLLPASCGFPAQSDSLGWKRGVAGIQLMSHFVVYPSSVVRVTPSTGRILSPLSCQPFLPRSCSQRVGHVQNWTQNV